MLELGEHVSGFVRVEVVREGHDRVNPRCVMEQRRGPEHAAGRHAGASQVPLELVERLAIPGK